MRTLAILLLSCFLLAGCRQEDWRTATFDRPAGLPEETLRERIYGLDTQTPPQVTLQGDKVHVRYNSLHLAKKNIEFILRMP